MRYSEQQLKNFPVRTVITNFSNVDFTKNSLGTWTVPSGMKYSNFILSKCSFSEVVEPNVAAKQIHKWDTITQEVWDSLPIGAVIVDRVGKRRTKVDNRLYRINEKTCDFALSLLGYTTSGPFVYEGELVSTSELFDPKIHILKSVVRTKAEQLIKDHGFCNIVEDALAELDIPKPAKVWKIGDSFSRDDWNSLPIGTTFVWTGFDPSVRFKASETTFVADDEFRDYLNLVALSEYSILSLPPVKS